MLHTNAIQYNKAIAFTGNTGCLHSFQNKLNGNDSITIGFIGGSITQGSVATLPENCYAYRVYEWFCSQYPNHTFSYVNAGIGATDSAFACARVEEDLLCYEPDLCFVEFSVNDECDDYFKETYEGLIRRILTAEHTTDVILLHNLYYEKGNNAQSIHEAIGRHYGLPCISIRDAIYPAVLNGEIARSMITPDNLHPNDLGHEIVADIITRSMAKLLKTDSLLNASDDNKLPASLTMNRYEKSKRIQSTSRTCCYDEDGFVPDASEQKHITDIFKHGWSATEMYDSISFHVNCKTIAVQYRKTIQHPAPIAKVTVDDQYEYILDANFDETWGDKLVLQNVLEEQENSTHEVKIELIETHKNDKLPFYLTSLILS